MGFNVTEADIRALESPTNEVWTGEMFAEILLAKPEYADSDILRPYRTGGPRSDNPYVNFYWDYYSQGKPCYAHVEFPSLEDTIRVIHKNGGKAVLAHPAVNLKNRYELLGGIIPGGIDGIEAYSSYHAPAEAAFFRDKAKEYGLFVTCGSDYHGKTKPAIQIGASGCDMDSVEFEGQLRI
jgi:hypothetical protein